MMKRLLREDASELDEIILLDTVKKLRYRQEKWWRKSAVVVQDVVLILPSQELDGIR